MKTLSSLFCFLLLSSALNAQEIPADKTTPKEDPLIANHMHFISQQMMLEVPRRVNTTERIPGSAKQLRHFLDQDASARKTLVEFERMPIRSSEADKKLPVLWEGRKKSYALRYSLRDQMA